MDIHIRFLVEVTGFEPATFWSRNPSKCTFLSSPDRKRPAFSSLFCLRRTGGDRFGCRIVASFSGNEVESFCKNRFWEMHQGSAFATADCNHIAIRLQYVGIYQSSILPIFDPVSDNHFQILLLGFIPDIREHRIIRYQGSTHIMAVFLE